jgi:hypothetical protein
VNFLRHKFQSAKSDGADATLVRPSNWNAEHDAGIELTNRTGIELVVGDIVTLSSANDESVVLGDTLDSMQAFLVAQGTIADLAAGLFTQSGAAVVKVAGPTVRGNYLGKSATTTALYDLGLASTSQLPPPGAVGIALTGAGAAGTVSAYLFGFTSTGTSGRMGTPIPSTALLPVPTGVTFAHVTGSNAISGIAFRPAGSLLVLTFSESTLLNQNSVFHLAGGQSHQTISGDTFWFISEGTAGWRQIAPFAARMASLHASSHVSVGANPALGGVIRLPNNAAIAARHSTNSFDMNLLHLNPSDELVLGPGFTMNMRAAGQLRCDLDVASRLVLPVGPDKWAV